MKRRLSLLLAVVMILGSFSFAFAAEETAAEAAGAFLKKVGILEGINGDLKLEDNLRRQDAVVLVARLHGAEDKAKAYSPEGLAFTDFKDPYYRPIIKWAVDEKLVEGHTAERFGFNEDITVQQYATILLRALGYNGEAEDYDKVMELAKKLGLLEDVKAEGKDAVTRGDMASMTFNALGTELKGEKKTLAEKLGIEMPAPAELKVEKVDTENLKEVMVELSNSKLVDKEKLEDANNYKLAGNVVEKATLEGNTVTVLLRDALVKGKEYELVIRGIDKAVNNKFKFTAKDNTIPKVEEVVVLGEYGIKVITSEPIANLKERNFLVDGKNIAMELEQYGRNIILTPYHKASFPENAKTLTVKGLEDFAGYKSVEEDFEIEVKKDTEGPKVEDVIARGNRVEVVFDKDIYNNSVDAYYSRTSVGNISYESGRHNVYAEKAEKIDTNKVVYTFKDELPRRTVVTIVDVENHSQVAMEKTTMEVREVVDNIEPEIIDTKVTTSSTDKTATIKLYFNKDVTGEFEKNSSDRFDFESHFTLYEREVLKRNVLENKDVSVKYDEDKDGKERKDVIVVKLQDLTVNNKDKDYSYILEVVGFVDAGSSRNKMYRDYVDFEVKPATSAFKVNDVYVSAETRARTEITIEFSKAVDRVIAEDGTNYIFHTEENAKKDVKDLKGDIVVEKNGKAVTLILPEFDTEDYDYLRILDTLKDKDGNRLEETIEHYLDENFKGLVERAEKAEKDATELVKGETTPNKKALEEALEELIKLKDYAKANHDKLVKAIEKVEKAIDKVEDDNKDAVAKDKKDLRKKIDEAEKVYKALKDKTTPEATELGAAIRMANYVMDDAKATEEDVKDAIKALEDAIEAVEADEKAAEDVVKAIKALPEVEDLKLEDKEAVDNAKEAFDKLTEAQKKLVGKDEVEKLDAVVAKMAELVEADEKAQKEEAKKALAAKISEAKVALVDGNDKEDDAKNTLKAAIAAAEAVLTDAESKTTKDLNDATKTLDDAIKAFAQ